MLMMLPRYAETLLPTSSDKVSVDTCISNHAVCKFYTLSEILFK